MRGVLDSGPSGFRSVARRQCTASQSAQLALAFALAVAAPMAAAGMPAEIMQFAQDNIASCRSAGGTPKLSGVRLPGAGRAAEGYPGYLTVTELNGDGLPDYVIDLAGLECVNAWSYFCGSAGCSVSVWVSGPNGYSVAWAGNARGWEQRGNALLMFLHGSMCTPPRIGADTCEVSVQFRRGHEGP